MPPADQQRIFSFFERAVSARHYGGLGLGLHITKQIIDALGGSIRVESEPGRGTVFIVELPIKRQASHNTQKGRKAGRNRSLPMAG